MQSSHYMNVQIQPHALFENKQTRSRTPHPHRQRLSNRLQRTEGDRDDLKADLQKQRKAAAIAQTQASDAEKLAHSLRETNKGLELELMAQRSQARAWQTSNPESNLQRIRELTDEVRPAASDGRS